MAKTLSHTMVCAVSVYRSEASGRYRVGLVFPTHEQGRWCASIAEVWDKILALVEHGWSIPAIVVD